MERLPDGRVVIEFGQHRLAFRPGPGVRDFQLVDNEHVGRPLLVTEALSDPERGRAFLDKVARALWLQLPNLRDRRGLYLGRFERGAVPQVAGSDAISLRIFRDAEPARHSPEARAYIVARTPCYAAENARACAEQVDALGMVRTPLEAMDLNWVLLTDATRDHFGDFVVIHQRIWALANHCIAN